MMTVETVPVNRRSDLILVLLTLIVFGTASLVTNLERALAFAVAFSIFLAIIQTKRDSWASLRFWGILAAIAIVHIVVLAVVHIPKLSIGLISLPIALVDGFAIFALLNWIDRHFPFVRDNDPDDESACQN